MSELNVSGVRAAARAALPIALRRADILDALESNQVIVVAGDTGSGKSTQLPQYCLEVGRQATGLIGHTQPRRLAARALAARIAEELGEPVGRTVGFRVRFADQTSASSRLVLMTDGLLLAELSSDPTLSRYSTLIVDEAHERTLNIDLLLGVLKRLLPQRADLKLIVTSATLDVQRVARFFGNAPVISVSGRGFPIEVRYCEPEASAESDDDLDLPTTVLQACRDIATEPGEIGAGDILIFLPGEREIRDVAEILERELVGNTEILPLYSRLSWEQQSKIFQAGQRPRIVLATNVAETSITVPGIRVVIDSGLARVSRYSVRSRLQRLPIEPISQASADQRKGRCGRIAAGLCLRLYSQSDFESRPNFTEPEILRTNLSALLLRLAADRLGQAEDFPFIDPPDVRALGDGYRLLQELQALDADRIITSRGRAMARLPLDPRLARVLLESQRFHAERELLAIVAGLSVPDARMESKSSDDAPIEDSKSEFSALYKLWVAYRQIRRGPRRELKRWCKERHLSLLRLSEWDDVYTQVVERAAQLGIVAGQQPASYAGVHRSLLAGFFTMVGTVSEEGTYLGTRGVRFHLFPGSPLKRRKPRWVMAASIVETSRVFARRLAEIEPQWIESAAQHLIKREYIEVDWDERREEVVARERITLLGLTLSAHRIINYGPIAPAEARLIFAREALVFQRLKSRPEWLVQNDKAIESATHIEERLRTRELLHSSEFFVEFYNRVLPPQVSSAATLELFSRRLNDVERDALRLKPEQVFARTPDAAILALFPEHATLAGKEVDLHYRFAPDDAADGVTVQIPLLALPNIDQSTLESLVPGLIGPRIEAMLRSLPKGARRSLIPMSETAAQFLKAQGSLQAGLSLSTWLHDVRGIPAALIHFDLSSIPRHLRIQVVAVHEGQEIQRGELNYLRRSTHAQARRALVARAHAAHPIAWQRFESDELPLEVDLPIDGESRVFPTLEPSLRVEYEWSLAEATRSYRQGATRLAQIMLHRQARDLVKKMATHAPLLLAAQGLAASDDLQNGLLMWVFEHACFGEADIPRTRQAFEEAVDQGRERLYQSFDTITVRALDWYTSARELSKLLAGARFKGNAEAVSESQSHLRRLLKPASIVSMAPPWIQQISRYIKAEERRWQRSQARAESLQVVRELGNWELRYQSLSLRLQAEGRWLPQLDELRWWIEEYRISLYAQEIKTLGPVSARRLLERCAAIEAWLSR